jgi:hypothetical protein
VGELSSKTSSGSDVASANSAGLTVLSCTVSTNPGTTVSVSRSVASTAEEFRVALVIKDEETSHPARKVNQKTLTSKETRLANNLLLTI